jgi:hypothetical protein
MTGAHASQPSSTTAAGRHLKGSPRQQNMRQCQNRPAAAMPSANEHHHRPKPAADVESLPFHSHCVIGARLGEARIAA